MPDPDRPVEDDQEDAGPTSRSSDEIDRKALETLVRRAAAGVYGVARIGRGGWRNRVLRLVGRGAPGVQASSSVPVRVELEVTLVPGVPVAQVANNVEDAVRYLVQRDLGIAIDDLDIRVHAAAAGSR